MCSRTSLFDTNRRLGETRKEADHARESNASSAKPSHENDSTNKCRITLYDWYAQVDQHA